jgi:hypothetical protein
VTALTRELQHASKADDLASVGRTLPKVEDAVKETHGVFVVALRAPPEPAAQNGVPRAAERV